MKLQAYLNKIIRNREQGNVLDYETAGCLHEIRAQLSGDKEFVKFLMVNMNIPSKTARMYLRTAKFYPKFQKNDWKKLGGRTSIQMLAYLTAAQRRKVMTKCWVKVKKNGRSVHASTVGGIIRKLGYRTKTPEQGRKRKGELETNLLLCQNWLDTLYSQYRLIAPPADVKKAMKRTNLGRAMKALRKAQ